MIFLYLLVAFLPFSLAIWPKPEYYTHGHDVIWISKDVQFNCRDNTGVNSQALLTSFQGESVLNSNNDSLSGSIVPNAIDQARRHLFDNALIPWKFHPRNSDFEPALNESKTCITSIDIIWPSTIYREAAAQPELLKESYSLHLSSKGEVQIQAATSIGVIHALNTFTQLFYQHSNPKLGIYTNLAPLSIRDKPRFVHRGLNLDVARNWYPVSTILQTIEILSWNKFNRLHLHITDSQSWPLEIPSLPSLASKGAYRTGLSYSPTDVRKIQSHGLLHGVQVYLEIDMPGHTASIGHAYPNLITAFNVQPNWYRYAAEPPSGQLKLNSSAVTNFTQTLFADLLPRLKPYTTYFHSGGDELNLNAYLLDETIRSNNTSIIKPFLQSFIDHVHAVIRSYGLTPIIWEDLVTTWNLTLGEDVIVQTWRPDSPSSSSLRKILRGGHRVLTGDYQNWYLDCGYGNWLVPRPETNHTYIYDDYCTPLKPWTQIWSFNPIPTGLSEDEERLILGAEVHLWSELTDPVNLQAKLWPRASAAGEVLWSGKEKTKANNGEQYDDMWRGLADAARRLAVWRERMVKRHVGASVVQMVYCTMSNGDDGEVGDCTI